MAAEDGVRGSVVAVEILDTLASQIVNELTYRSL
jgi:hypothetical protein